MSKQPEVKISKLKAAIEKVKDSHVHAITVANDAMNAKKAYEAAVDEYEKAKKDFEMNHVVPF